MFHIACNVGSTKAYAKGQIRSIEEIDSMEVGLILESQGLVWCLSQQLMDSVLWYSKQLRSSVCIYKPCRRRATSLNSMQLVPFVSCHQMVFIKTAFYFLQVRYQDVGFLQEKGF